MKRFKLSIICFAICFFCAAFGNPSKAEARRRGLMLITFGESIKEVGELPPALASNYASGTKISYKYSGFGVFWLNLWTWGGEYCLYDPQQDTVYNVPESVLASMGDAKPSKPIWYRCPPGLLLVLGFVVFAAIKAKFSDE